MAVEAGKTAEADVAEGKQDRAERDRRAEDIDARCGYDHVLATEIELYLRCLNQLWKCERVEKRHTPQNHSAASQI